MCFVRSVSEKYFTDSETEIVYRGAVLQIIMLTTLQCYHYYNVYFNVECYYVLFVFVQKITTESRTVHGKPESRQRESQTGTGAEATAAK